MHRVIALFVIIGICGGQNAAPVWADSKGEFPRKGSYTAWKNASVFFQHGVDWSNSGNMVKAADSFQHAINTYPNDSIFYYNLGIARTALGQMSEAETSFRTAVHLEKDYFQAWYNLGSLLYKQQRYDEALDAWKQASHIKHISPSDKESVARMIASLESRMKENASAGKENKKSKKEKNPKKEKKQKKQES